MRALSLLVISLLLLSASCKKTTETDKNGCYIHDKLPEIVIGKWQLVSSQSAWTGEITTPADNGYTDWFEFKSDGTLHITDSDGTDNTVNYSLSIMESYPVQYGVMYDSAWVYSTYFDCDELVLDNRAVDGPKKNYRRVD